MEQKDQPAGRTWDDVKKESGIDGHAPGGMQGPEGHGAPPHGEPKHGPRHGAPGKRVGAGRLTAYLLLTVLLNVLLAVYTLYILGISVETVQTLLAIGRVESIPRLLVSVLIMISPLLLTILFNRLLYCAMRGRGRFPRGIWLFAVLLVLLVQAATIYVIFTSGAAPALESFDVQSFTTTAEY